MGKILSTNEKINYTKRPVRQKRIEKQKAAKDKAFNDLVAEYDGLALSYKVAMARKSGGEIWKAAEEYMKNDPAFAKGVKKAYKLAARWNDALDKGFKWSDPEAKRYSHPWFEMKDSKAKELRAALKAKYPNDPEKAGNLEREITITSRRPFEKWMDEQRQKRLNKGK